VQLIADGDKAVMASSHVTLPLTASVLEILEGLAVRAKKTESDFVFPARGKPEQSYTGLFEGQARA
jgi:hypothetical protein